ncbi:MAG: AMP-binding protein [Pseudomonadota bacterium]
MFDFAGHGLIESAIKLPLPGAGPQTLAAVLDRPLQNTPRSLALAGRSGRLDYAELERQVRRACVAMAGLGVGRYDRVAACLDNDLDIVIAMLACARLGAIWVGVNRPLAAPEKAFLLSDSAANVYLTDDNGASEIQDQRRRLSALKTVVSVGTHAGDEQWRTLLDGAEETCVRRDIDAFEPAAIAYTSGTTGRPKGAVHSHHNILLPGAMRALERTYAEPGNQGVMLPLTILNLMVLAPLTAFQYGAACVCMDSMKPASIARWVRDYRINHFASVPTVIQDLLTSAEVDPSDLATLGQPDIGGAGIAESFQTLYKQRFGQPMTVAYGMTEAPTIVSKTAPGQAPETDLCGRAVSQVELLIIDDAGLPVAPGTVGEVCVRPARSGAYAGLYTTMLGYWNNAEATAQALGGEMYHTGDLGYLTADGQLYVKGRTKELIIRGGANVYPAEVERVLDAHDQVQASAVMGVDDVRLGQRVVAVVQPVGAVANEATLEADLKSHCEQQIARYKVPAEIRCIPTLPRNAMNKVLKPVLLQQFWRASETMQ